MEFQQWTPRENSDISKWFHALETEIGSGALCATWFRCKFYQGHREKES